MDQDSLEKTAIAVPSERPAGQSDPFLVVIAGPGLGQSYDLGHTVDIGRHDECEISVPSSKVSRRHAQVQKILGKYIVADLESTNGTYVNGARLNAAHHLRDGDQIKVGDVVLKFTESKLELQYHQQIQAMAARDALTGAQNKRAFDQVLSQRLQIPAPASEGALGLLLFDIDHFKRVNDQHGHPAGDYVLKELSKEIQGRLGQAQLYRLGGEEFAILGNWGDVAQTSTLAESLRAQCEARHFVHGGERIPVTLSFGVTLARPPETPDSLVKRADELLYQSKRNGRNRVTVG